MTEILDGRHTAPEADGLCYGPPRPLNYLQEATATGQRFALQVKHRSKVQ